MRYFFLILLITAQACNGRLSDEQRKKLKDGMKRNEIKKVSDARLTEGAFALGRQVTSRLGKSVSTQKIDSVERVFNVRIKILKAATSDALETQIVDAYVEGSGKVKLEDNIQKVGPDSLLYTKPMVRLLPDGAEEFNYAIGIRMSKRDVVNSIKD